MQEEIELDLIRKIYIFLGKEDLNETEENEFKNCIDIIVNKKTTNQLKIT